MTDEIKERLKQTGLRPIFNEQTPKVVSKTELTDELRKTVDDLVYFAEFNEYLKLAGLAANQLAKNKERLDLNVCLVYYDYCKYNVAINPVIIEQSGGSFSSNEGCLTWPRQMIKAERHHSIVVEYTDLEGSVVTREANDFEAIVWQHEINHLEGVPEYVVDPRVKLKPNQPCFCNSGKKFKRCCGR